MKYDKQIIEKAVEIRRSGGTYDSIRADLALNIPKSTLSGWLRDLPESEQIRYQNKARDLTNLQRARSSSIEYYRKRRESLEALSLADNQYLKSALNNSESMKIALSMLYLGEGTKNPRRGCVTFGNSDPETIQLFLKLFRVTYCATESKFRVTVLCRGDQDGDALSRYWSGITGIPLERFYRPRYDQRTLGKPTKKKEYPGVCVISYFSTEALRDILASIKILKGP